MESVYHIVTIHVNETSWAQVWRLCSRYLRTGMTQTGFHVEWFITTANDTKADRENIKTLYTSLKSTSGQIDICA
jgi:hypothetical protein